MHFFTLVRFQFHRFFVYQIIVIAFISVARLHALKRIVITIIDSFTTLEMRSFLVFLSHFNFALRLRFSLFLAHSVARARAAYALSMLKSIRCVWYTLDRQRQQKKKESHVLHVFCIFHSWCFAFFCSFLPKAICYEKEIDRKRDREKEKDAQ